MAVDMMKCMKKIFLLFSLATSLSTSFAQDSAVVKRVDNKIAIEYGEQTVTPTQTISVNSDVTLYVIKSGDVGTSVMVTVYRGIIWSESEQKVLAMYPYRYEVSADAPYEIDQPVWTISEKKISVEDSNIDLKTSLDL